MKTTYPPEFPTPISIPTRRLPRSTPPPLALWSTLDPLQQRQLAQCLATLLRRMQPLDGRPPKEGPHHDQTR